MKILTLLFLWSAPLLADYCWEDRYGNTARLCDGCNNPWVSLSTPPYDYGIEFNSLWLIPTTSNTHYSAETHPNPLPSPNWKVKDIRPDYHYGFDVGFKASFCDRNSVASLNYMHFQSKDSNCRKISKKNRLGPFFAIGPDAIPFNQARGRVNTHFDAVNIDYGICVQWGDYLETLLFGGIGGAWVKQDYEVKYRNFDHSVKREIKVPSAFAGAGPQLGLDFTFSLWEGLELNGGGKGTLLFGNLENHTKFKSASPFLKTLGIPSPNRQKIRVGNRTALVPAFEGYIGIGCSFNYCSYTIYVDGGYQALIYLNAIQSVDIGSEAITPPVTPDTVAVFACTFQRNISHFALSGPYFKLGLEF